MDPLIPSGQPAPDFTLNDLNGRPHSLSDYHDRLVILNFWSAECPHAQRVAALLEEYRQDWGESVALLHVASNTNEPLKLLQRVASNYGLISMLHDPSQQVADLYGAMTTPHIFAVDTQGLLRYQGALDDVTFHQRTPTRLYLREAVEALLKGGQPDPRQTPPYGCVLVRHAP